MMAHLTRYKALLGLVLALCLCACQGRGCGQREKLGRLIEITGGIVQRDDAAPPEQWEQVELGADFAPGDGLRTPPQTAAVVQFADGSELLVKPGSVVRFRTLDSASDRGFDLVAGEAVMRAGSQATQLRTHAGVATLKAGAKLQLIRAADGGLRVHLEVGDATFRTSDGKDVVLSSSEDLRLEIGAAVIRQPSAAAAPDPQPEAAESKLQLDVTQPEVRARAKREASARTLAVGKLGLARETELSISGSGSATLYRELDRVQLFEGEYRVDDGENLVTARRGKLRMHAESHDVHIAVPGGWIVARAANGGSEAEIDLDDKQGELHVSRGEVSWQRGGTQKQVKAGEPLRWQLTAADTAPSEPGPSITDSPERASLGVRAGESFVLHSPELPVALELKQETGCSGALVAELNGGARFRGTDKSVKLWLDDKVRSYSLRCQASDGRLSKPSARANVRVLHDAGTRDLPPRAPTSSVDADGRGYTIYYQNQLPDVRVRWPSPPEGNSYQLDVDGKQLALKAPEYTFNSGGLGDGVHHLTFSAKERRSRTTTVEVRFDNTATTASLSEPKDRSFSPGAEVDVEGVLLPAWKVSLDGGMIEKVGEDRFHGRIVTTPQNPDFAVRLFHPRLGTHYYLRRAAGAP